MTGRYDELRKFEIEIRNIFMMSSYNIDKDVKVSIVMNWLGHEGLRFIQTLTDNEQEICKMRKDLFEMLCEKFKPQHNEMIHYSSIVR